MELLQTFEYKEVKVETYYIGTDKLHSKTYINGELVYEDESFRPSPMYCIDSVETMCSLLGFLTLSANDVEEEFFIKRDSPLLDSWANAEEYSNSCQEIKMMLYDFDCAEDEGFLKENEMTWEDATKITNHIIIN